ncbi:hypothetical protein Gohar_008562 [Gossypium harknessii]|uniref:Uncharacterized protein n=1 Tax=Gossypium harknessii TaxID=34285 RepID=A0A7J9GK30_9ROSI|nr:hypothetical protein [Gossypium harknessii]
MNISLMEPFFIICIIMMLPLIFHGKLV